MIRRLCVPAFLLAVALLLNGCLFDHPLTGGASKDINTWLLGIWSFKDPEKDQSFRLTVIPKNGDHYNITLEALGKNDRPTKHWQMTGWISRVGRGSFLSIQCDETSGQIAPGQFFFVHYQVLNQNNVLIRPLILDSPSDASSFQLRQEVRKKLKDRILYAQEGQVWTRISEIYWNPSLPGPQPMQPLRFPKADEYLQKEEKKKNF